MDAADADDIADKNLANDDSDNLLFAALLRGESLETIRSIVAADPALLRQRNQPIGIASPPLCDLAGKSRGRRPVLHRDGVARVGP